MKTLAYHILDITENAVTAKADGIEISIDENTAKDYYEIIIKDNGTGMTKETLRQVSDPFYTSRTTRRVGLGIPLFRQNALQSGGRFSIVSKPGKGTTVKARFGLSHLDRPPVGNLQSAILHLIFVNPEIHFVYQHKTAQDQFSFDTNEIKKAVGDIPLNHPKVKPLLQEMIQENLKHINAINS
ncbi:MAG: ATP-binding protein [Bacteroidales bacterium]